MIYNNNIYNISPWLYMIPNIDIKVHFRREYENFKDCIFRYSLSKIKKNTINKNMGEYYL